MINGRKVVIEGAQAAHLDLLHGDYPYVTSSQCNPSGTLSGAGIGPKYVNKVIAVIKAYCSRVGDGPFPTEQNNYTGTIIRELGNEYGTTTGRSRRCGWLDLVAFDKLAGYTDICLNHLDTIGKIGLQVGHIKVCIGYTYNGKNLDHFPSNLTIAEKVLPQYRTFEGGWEIKEGTKTFDELPQAAKDFVTFIETFTGIPVTYIGVGPRNEDTIIR